MIVLGWNFSPLKASFVGISRIRLFQKVSYNIHFEVMLLPPRFFVFMFNRIIIIRIFVEIRRRCASPGSNKVFQFIFISFLWQVILEGYYRGFSLLATWMIVFERVNNVARLQRIYSDKLRSTANIKMSEIANNGKPGQTKEFSGTHWKLKRSLTCFSTL